MRKETRARKFFEFFLYFLTCSLRQIFSRVARLISAIKFHTKKVFLKPSKDGENTGAGEPPEGEESRDVAPRRPGREEERGLQVEKARLGEPVVWASERRGDEHETREGDATFERLERPDDEDWTRTSPGAKESGERSAGVSVENERDRHQTAGSGGRRG